MDDTLKTMLFAEDLLNYVLNSHDIPTRQLLEIDFVRTRFPESPFDTRVGKSVVNIIEKKTHLMSDVYRELIEEVYVTDATMFARYAIAALPEYFPYGYTHQMFIIFCAMVIGVAEFYYEIDKPIILKCAAEVISIVLTAYIITGEFKQRGGWELLNKFCLSFNKAVYAMNVGELEDRP